MKVPNWVKCEECCRENTVHCMSCIVKYETASYLNYAYKGVITTNTTVDQNKR